MRNSDFRTDINGLRGISLALVVAYHLQVRGAAGGFIGVDVFFVISGFLMTRIVCHDLAADRFNYWRFAAARAARIWPALAALLVVLFTLGSFWLPPFVLFGARKMDESALLQSAESYRDRLVAEIQYVNEHPLATEPGFEPGIEPDHHAAAGAPHAR